MINRLSNVYGEISHIVKALYYSHAFGTRAIHDLTTHDTLSYMLEYNHIAIQHNC